jgi:putative protease
MRPELMAPAGDWEAMRAAVANGADSVYFGLDQFNARHRATNFTLEELPRVMAYLHGHNVKGFITFNTLIFSDELPRVETYIRAVAAAGVDALIVQDLGLAKVIHAIAPGMGIHGSTQMTLTEPRGMEFVRELGVGRVVVARELSVLEIGKIMERTDMPLEVFVHGALCVSYSGQCLTSESLGGRSANRGQCAQACRLPYQLIVDGVVKDLGDKAYLLSPQDLAAHDLVGDLAKLGVASLKIEGRLKSAHYVAATTQTYRAAIDAARDGETFVISSQQKFDLDQSFSRGFSHGFLGGANHQVLVQGRFPKARGIRVGTVAEKFGTRILVQMERSGHTLKPGDGVVFDEGHPEQDEQGGRVFFVHPGKQFGTLEIELGNGDVNLAAIAQGAIVWKTDDPAMRKRLENSFARERVVKRVGVRFQVTARVGEKLRVVISDGVHEAEAQWEKTLETAQKFPVTEAVLREQLGRLGDSVFELEGLVLETAGGPMVPKSVLNDLRRKVVAELDGMRTRAARYEIAEGNVVERMRAEIADGSARATHAQRPFAPFLAGREIDRAAEHGTPSNMNVLVRTGEQLEAVLAYEPPAGVGVPMVYCDFEDVRRYGAAVERCRAAGRKIALATLRVVKPHEEGTLRQIAECGPDAVLVRNLAAVSFYKEKFPGLGQIGDYSLNVSNEITADIFRSAGLLRMVPSYDLNWQQLGAMIGRFAAGMFECVIHQHMPMFHMEHCVFAHTLSQGKDFRDCGRPCERHQVDLGDRVGQPHPLIPDVGCRNTVFNALAQTAAEFVPEMKLLGVRHFRIELLRENAAETGRVLEQYGRVLAGLEEARTAIHSLKVLNQLGVTRGTLVHE